MLSACWDVQGESDTDAEAKAGRYGLSMQKLISSFR